MSAQPGYFGKLPGAGDFVQRRLPPVFVDAWDRAFSHALAGARDMLGEAWSQAYHVAPAWRFLLAPGVIGPVAWAGVVLPASDRVGRCFPMVVAARLPGGAAHPGVLDDGGRWFDQVTAVARAAQADRTIDPARFDAAVAALELPDDPAEPTVPVLAPSLERERRRYWLPLQDGLRLPTVLWSHLAPSGRCTLWWQHGGNGVEPALYVGAGLPDAGEFAGFLHRRIAEVLP